MAGRSKLDEPTVNRYINIYKLGRKMPHVRVAKIRKGLVLVDGWHRIAALEMLGETSVSVEIVETNEKEAHYMAAMANIGHGLPLKSTEVREVFRAYMRAGKYLTKDETWLEEELKSYRKIAAEIGGLKSYSTIRSWMKADFPKTTRQYGSEETRKGKGGLPDNMENTFGIMAVKSLDEALAYFRCNSNEASRSKIIEYTEVVLKEMKKDKSVEPVLPNDDF